MVGGTVIETLVTDTSVWVNVRDGSETCGVLLERTPEARSISERDDLWWDGSVVSWTPRYRMGGRAILKSAVKIKRLGGAGCVKRPESA